MKKTLAALLLAVPLTFAAQTPATTPAPVQKTVKAPKAKTAKLRKVHKIHKTAKNAVKPTVKS